MCISISDWFTAAYMTYYNFTIRPPKFNITALYGHDIAYPARLLGYLSNRDKIKVLS